MSNVAIFEWIQFACSMLPMSLYTALIVFRWAMQRRTGFDAQNQVEMGQVDVTGDDELTIDSLKCVACGRETAGLHMEEWALASNVDFERSSLTCAHCQFC